MSERKEGREKNEKDLELVRRVLRREPEAVREFVRRSACIVRFLYTINRRRHAKLDRHSIEDLAQKVFLEVWSRVADYRGDAGLETWIWRFCYLQLLAWIQSPKTAKSRKEGEDALLEIPAGDREPEEQLDERFDRLAMAHALAELPEEKRRLIAQKHFEGKTFEVIAREQKVAVSTLKDRYYQALMDLQSLASRWRDRVEKDSGSMEVKNPIPNPAEPAPELLSPPEKARSPESRKGHRPGGKGGFR